MDGAPFIYLDHAATTPVDPRVVEAMIPFFTRDFANPSSQHFLAQAVGNRLDRERNTIERLLECPAGELIFTSGGTEANNLALLGVAQAYSRRGKHLVVSQIEHASILEAAVRLEQSGFQVTYLPVTPAGIIDLQALDHSLTDGTILVSIMAVNNETGIIQPIPEIAQKVHERGSLLHVDAVQALGKGNFSLSALGADLVTLSAHKIYGPKGIGLLFLRRGVHLTAQMVGGGQERGYRAGTENVAGIAGFAKALELLHEEASSLPASAGRIRHCRDRLQQEIQRRIPEAWVVGEKSPRIPDILTLCFRGVGSEGLVIGLGEWGIAVNPGSACRLGGEGPSYVLRAMGIPEEYAEGAIRFSFGRGTDPETMPYVAQKVQDVVEHFQKLSI